MTRRILALVPLGDAAIADPFAAVAAATDTATRHGLHSGAMLLGRPGYIDDAAMLAAQEGAAEITLVTHPGLDDPPLIEQMLALFTNLLGGEQEPLLLILPGGVIGEELAARLAARLDAVPLGRCSALALDGAAVTAHRPAYGGSAELVLTTEAPRCIAVLRRPAEPPAATTEPAVTQRMLDIALPSDTPRPTVQPAAADRPRRVDAARLVVSGGRGMGGPEGFAQLRELATLLDAATGASLPAVDAGWAGVSQQVGQSGAFVAPDLYLAVAMSGTPQHLAGIARRSRIAAINADPEADIFRVAEIGLAAPWQEVLPRLIERMRDD
jgi:electron transfer flavoprotein alpha subunit